MLGQMGGRRHHFFLGVASAFELVVGADHPLACGLHVDLSEAVLQPLIADDDPTAAALVPA